MACLKCMRPYVGDLLRQKDARIAELTTQLEAEATVASMQFDQIAELTAEVTHLRAALHECAFKPNWIDDCQSIARNALKDK